MSEQHAHPDVVVVGAGMGGIVAIHRLVEAGLSVVGLEAAPDVGGVWYHNAYPGARVDLESDVFCYTGDADLYREWAWSERYATQKEVLAYLHRAAEKFDVRRHIRFNTRLEHAQWDPEAQRWRLHTEDGTTIEPRFLVMATGQLSRPRDPNFPGLADFRGQWLQTSRWPQEGVDLTGKRVAVVGTGSSGVQTITEIAGHVGEMVVFQRTPHFVIPANNRAADRTRRAMMANRADDLRMALTHTSPGCFFPPPAGPADAFTFEEQQALVQQRYDFGTQSLVTVFSDQGVDWDSNTIVSEFVRAKVRDMVAERGLPEHVIPADYPIGTKRLIMDVGYYDALLQDNVTIVDVSGEARLSLTETGVRTATAEYEVDVVIFAVGFEAFHGAIDEAGIRNESGLSPTSFWTEGPATYFGLQTRGFPNLFFMTGPGSPSVLANMFLGSEHHADVITDLIVHMRENGLTLIEPRQDAQDAWGEHAAAAAEPLIRRQIDQYMITVTKAGDRVFIPYVGGFDRYVEQVNEALADGYRGWEFS